jgi:mono/diheme cytochrome c family protein
VNTPYDAARVKWYVLLAVLGASQVTTVQAEEGAELFSKNCLPCHQAAAAGLPGEYPRLAGRVAAITAVPAGRRYVIDVLSFGMTGTVIVDGRAIEKGVMPTFNWLTPAEVASVVKYVQSLGATGTPTLAALTAAEVVVRRKQTAAAPIDAHAERQSLVKAKIVP